MLDLQKLTLKRLLETQSSDFFSKLASNHFTDVNKQVFQKIELFYKANLRVPTFEEFIVTPKESSLQDYIITQILDEDNRHDGIANEFLLAQLQDHCVREETITFVEKLLDGLEDMEKSEILDVFQNHMLELNKTIPMSDELFDVGDLDIIPKGDSFALFPSGLSEEYDSVNGGFARQELVLIGGRRGSGKSIITLNLAYNRFKQGSTIAFFSIEMRYKEVYDRLLSMMSGVDFLNIYKNQLSHKEKLQIVETKINAIYDTPKDHEVWEQINKLKTDPSQKGFLDFESWFKMNKPPFKPHRFFIIDDPGLSLNRIDHYCNMFGQKYENFTMAVVDYINIVKEKENKEWKTQIDIADTLKLMSRKYDVTMISPYQIDASGEARFAKGILDSADRSFTFMPADLQKDGDPNSLEMYTTKIRNGKAINFKINMDWPCLRINPDKTLTSTALPVEKYGSEGEGEQEL